MIEPMRFAVRGPPRLREDQIEVLRRYGETRKAEAGEVLFRANDASNDFTAVLEGEVEVVDDFDGEARTMGVMRCGSGPTAEEASTWPCYEALGLKEVSSGA
jgi:hypothetical protein